MTASSIFKAFLPSEARATNCTSQAGQDGIHRTALPLISAPSAANQTHHIAAFCLLKAARAKKVNSSSTSMDQKKRKGGGEEEEKNRITFLYLSVSLFLVRFYLQETGVNHSKRSLPSRIHLSLLTVTRTALQLCLLLLGQLYHLRLHTQRL